jgi:hypothetical protein
MERVRIGCNFRTQPYWKLVCGVPLIYLPIVTTIPFVVIGALLIKTHLKYIGGTDIKPYWDFVPSWISHRYKYESQITFTSKASRINLARYKYYWVFNCKLYCPMSVALFRYTAYLVKIVENWWCPFDHDCKHEYAESAVDRSFWHVYSHELESLHPEDRENPVWNEDTENRKIKTLDASPR